jgi:hypothetical protein
LSIAEIYRGQDGSLYKITRLSINPLFFKYEGLSEEERKCLMDLPYNDSGNLEDNAGSFGDQATEPAADDISPGGNKTDYVK